MQQKKKKTPYMRLFYVELKLCECYFSFLIIQLCFILNIICFMKLIFIVWKWAADCGGPEQS